MHKRYCLLFSLILLSLGCAKKTSQTTPAAPGIAAQGWTKVEPLQRPLDLSATQESFWLSGAQETIASSSDGGNTWQTRQRKAGGRALLKVDFIDNKIGHASGDGGLLLSTTDGGRTWNSQVLGVETVQLFSFSDSANGIALLSGQLTHAVFKACGLRGNHPFPNSLPNVIPKSDSEGGHLTMQSNHHGRNRDGIKCPNRQSHAASAAQSDVRSLSRPFSACEFG